MWVQRVWVDFSKSLVIGETRQRIRQQDVEFGALFARHRVRTGQRLHTLPHGRNVIIIGIEAVPFRRGNELQQFRRLLRPLPGGLESALLIKFGQQLRGRYGNVATIQPARDLHALDFKPQRLGEVCR